ncbi:hypothetical protein BTN50_1412 [Candidatus Enterovibrio altilux]|uniref:Uncharacterized protein n=1 Tax=Candidatus Enterovibrio altilux TaxID=1927128 RepID=A0A291BA80_9GAMM|nr:hypothetical protein BTN50_1412 [Candidatus Enterovibrio luxaltus]
MRIFNTIKSLQGFINSVFKLTQLPFHALTVHALVSKPQPLTSHSRRRLKS